MISRLETITHVAVASPLELVPGISLLEFASSKCGAIGFSTGLARVAPGAELAYHYHECGESITILAGECELAVEGRTYVLHPYDSLHVPKQIAHAVKNLDGSSDLVLHTAFSSSSVTRNPANGSYVPGRLAEALSAEHGPEALQRFSLATAYELSANAWFKDLFAGRLGARGICGGYGRFAPGASLPCHTHLYDESITIVEGSATCLVAGRRYTLSGCDTALVPQGLPHRFINESDQPMAMVWVYAGDEPERVIVENGRCAKGN
jgi:quercetin dioxygenase-like cupin family protein